MKSNKKEDKKENNKQNRMQYSPMDMAGLFEEDNDMVIQENEDYKKVNMTSAIRKLMGIKSTKKKEK